MIKNSLFQRYEDLKSKILQIKERMAKDRSKELKEVSQELNEVHDAEVAYQSKKFSYGQKDAPERDTTAI